ncbi:MAG TPA: c-type cytochrome biogenesis protein CcsB [Streptosporangiaceae bacterium]|nr:c-type cytochrome biogenesis protein CcsB [Streptosporangiaceae bacterium]
MPVNTTLADFSNGLLLSTLILYALAMLCYASDFAFARHRVIAGTGEADAGAAAPEAAAMPELVTAGAGSGSAPASGASQAGAASLAIGGRQGSAGAGTAAVAGAAGLTSHGGPSDNAPASRWPSGFWLRLAFGLTCTGVVLHVLAILTRGLAEHRVPWGNMYEFIGAFTCMAVLVLIAASVWYRAYYMGLFVLLPVVLALGIDLTWIYTPAGALVPALQSYWIAIHVTAMIVAIGLFIFGAVVTTLYLLTDRSQRRLAAGLPSWSAGIWRHLPVPSILDRLSYRSVLFGFPVWTFGVMAGAIWADHAWGRYWGWDPKETWSFITWVVYAMFLHARATAGWRGRRAAWIHLAGFACLMFNVIGVNLWITGLHSYAGMS